MTCDPSGNIYVAESNNYDVRLITYNGAGATSSANYTVSTLAGSTQGFADGTGTAAHFGQCYGITYWNGSLYVADYGSNAIRQVSTSGVVTTIAGTGTAGTTDGPGNTALLSHPCGIVATGNALVVSEGVTTAGAVNLREITQIPGGANNFQIACDTSGNIYIADDFGVRRLSPGGTMSTVAGSGSTNNPIPQDGPGNVATFGYAIGIAVAPSGEIYVSDVGSSTVDGAIRVIQKQISAGAN